MAAKNPLLSSALMARLMGAPPAWFDVEHYVPRGRGLAGPTAYYIRPCMPPGAIYAVTGPLDLCDGCTSPAACRTKHSLATKEPAMPDASTHNLKAATATANGKAPLQFLEPVCNPGEARVLAGGAKKYGRRNFTKSEMLWSTYIGSMRRHLDALDSGEDLDPESGEHHLSHIRANVAVLQAAEAAGTLVDDRLFAEVLERSDAVHKDGNLQAKDGSIAVDFHPCQNGEPCECGTKCAGLDNSSPASDRLAKEQNCDACSAKAGEQCGRLLYKRDDWPGTVRGGHASPCPIDGSTSWKGGD